LNIYDSDTQKGPVKFQLIEEELKRREKAVVIVPLIKSLMERPSKTKPTIITRSDDARLEEAIGLAEAIDLDIVHAGLVSLKVPKPAALFGSGKVKELAGIVAAKDAGLVIVDHTLTPVQQQNLEKEWNAKVLDRTGLILEIFGARARTKEGRLQVELAHLNYQKGRLVRSWTHLERQRGALGFVGGPGETQIESDRRQLQEKINRLEVDLDKVRKTRELHRSRRQKIPHPVVALVGRVNMACETGMSSDC
jgi:GTP-binding protein HflX